jgi:hypothetical protein
MTTTVDKVLNKETKFKANLIKKGYILKETNKKHTLESFFTTFDELQENVLLIDLDYFRDFNLKYLKIECDAVNLEIEKVGK